MQVMEQTAPTTPAAPEEALEAARAVVNELETALAGIPTEYSKAAKRGRAGEMKDLRHRRIDLEEELHAARIVAIHAEIAVLQGTQVASRLRESGIAQDIATTEAALLVARDTFDAAARARNDAEARATANRWESQHTRELVLLAQDRLAALVSAPMPD